MNSVDRSILIAAIQEVLETMFFTFVDPIDEDETSDIGLPSGGYFHGRIGIKGAETKSTLDVFLPEQMATTLAETLFDSGDNDTSITENKIIDITKELANMILGNILNKADKEGRYRLTTPTGEFIKDICPYIKDDARHTFFETDWGIMVIISAL